VVVDLTGSSPLRPTTDSGTSVVAIFFLSVKLRQTCNIDLKISQSQPCTWVESKLPLASLLVIDICAFASSHSEHRTTATTIQGNPEHSDEADRTQNGIEPSVYSPQQIAQPSGFAPYPNQTNIYQVYST
jgi:hypothetical protein